MRRSSALAAATAALLLSGTAAAHTVAICHDGGPGSTRQAADAVQQFMRHVEKVAGLSANTLDGEYHTSRKKCASYVGSAGPVLALLDTATYLAHAGSWKLTPVAHMGGADAIRYHVLVREGTAADLAALDGKSVAAALPKDDAYLAQIALSGKGSPASWSTSFVRGALKALRKVAREQVDAAVVDQEAYAHLGELDLPSKLVSVHTSEAVPGLTMFSVGTNAGSAGDVVARIEAALPRLCDGDGAGLCKNFKISRFTKAKANIYQALRKRYGR